MAEFLKNFALVPRDIIAIPLMALIFVIFWRAFGSLVVKRHLALFEARERNSVGARHGAEENINSAARLKADYERQLNSERVSIAKSLEPAIVSARSEAARIVESAEAEAATLIESTRKSISDELSKLATVVEKDADALAATISERAVL